MKVVKVMKTQRNTEIDCDSVNPAGKFKLPSLTGKEKARFWINVDKTKNCWIWMGSKSTNGYGSFYAGRNYSAHRISFLLSGGMLSAEKPLVIHGPCHNRLCVNPEHLRAGDDKDNARDRVRDGTVAAGERNGSRVHPERLPRGEDHHSALRPETIVRGERQGRAKLTDSDVQKIRSRYARGGVSQKDLATEYGVANQLISRVIHRKNWTHV